METVLDYLHRVARYDWWVVLVELLLIGLVVYWVVDFLEGTRGERLFRGVLFILFAGVLTLNIVGEQFGLFRLGYLYKGFLIAVLIVAVAAFQPEIRRVLMRIGQSGFLAGSLRAATTTEEIVSAVGQLAASRTGGIIVIEGQVALGEFIEGGVRMDAVVSSELLRTIFHAGTPLHDMAVVVRGDRIVAARVQLPLEDHVGSYGLQLGSRHRAAIGITAGSDAICIVASEETGVVSLAENGRLTRNIDEDAMRKRLKIAVGG